MCWARQPPNLSSFLANYPKELDDILKKCLAKDPAERFQTAGELSDKLSRVQQELQRSQTAPTIIRSTPLPNDSANSPLASQSQRPNPSPVSSEKIQQVATKSAEYAQEWWKIASPRARRNVVTLGAAAVLYLIAIPLIAAPIAILAGIILVAQAPFVRKWWASASMKPHLAAGVLVTAVAAFCFTKLATGVMWYVGFSGNHLMAIPVGAVIATIVGANVGLALDWWESASGKARGLGVVASSFLIVCFAVSAMNWSSTPTSYFARGGEFEQREKANQTILKAQSETYDSAQLQIWTDTSLLTRVQFYRSRLMWTNKDNGKQLSWLGAKEYCSTLRLGGYADWRLPSVDELNQISEGKRTFAENILIYHVKKGMFLSNPGVWSSTEGTGINFNNQTEGGGRALCVRVDNGQSPTQTPQATASLNEQAPSVPLDSSSNAQSTQSTPSLTGVFSDSETGLMWQKESGKSERTWSQADAYCHDLQLGGFSDWRLATLNELESVSPHHSSELSLPSLVIWSSERTADSRQAWFFYFFDGRRYKDPVNETLRGPHALCVRGTFNGHNSVAEAAESARAAEATAQQIAQQQKDAYVSAIQSVWADPSVKGLMWMNKDNGRDISWINAESFCRASRLSSYSDWRLPTINELNAIYDGQPNLHNTGGIYHVKNGIYLSAPFIWSSEEVKSLNFLYGVTASSGGSSYNARALCVRSSR
jgi:hypothetical protein